MIETRNLVKTFKDGDVETKVLKGIDFKAENGEFIIIMGRSGSGKSTFLYQMSLLDEPTSGQIIIDHKDTHKMTPAEKIAFRLTKCGYVFQDYALMPELTAVENVVLPLLMQGLDRKSAYATAKEALTKVGLAHRFNNVPSNMSGGEQQRTSIARAIAHKPKILFADEPTANLDNESSKSVIDIFKELHKEGQTIIMVTHEDQYAAMAQKVIKLDDGKIISEEIYKITKK
jgi:putative ABC transport system ATP-binding protein